MKHVPYSSNEKKNIFQKLVRTLVNQLTTGPLIYNSKMDLLEKSPPPHTILPYARRLQRTLTLQIQMQCQK